jgi:hypothetical protein
MSQAITFSHHCTDVSREDVVSFPQKSFHRDVFSAGFSERGKLFEITGKLRENSAS